VSGAGSGDKGRQGGGSRPSPRGGGGSRPGGRARPGGRLPGSRGRAVRKADRRTKPSGGRRHGPAKGLRNRGRNALGRTGRTGRRLASGAGRQAGNGLRAGAGAAARGRGPARNAGAAPALPGRRGPDAAGAGARRAAGLAGRAGRTGARKTVDTGRWAGRKLWERMPGVKRNRRRRLRRLGRRERRRVPVRRKLLRLGLLCLLVMLILTPMCLATLNGWASATPSSPGPMGSAATVPGVPYADVFDAGSQHLMDPRLLAAVAWVESGGFDPEVISCGKPSPSGRKGIMGLQEHVAANLGIDPCDPGQAVRVSATLLIRLFQQLKSWPAALGAYHMAPAADPAAAGGTAPGEDENNYIEQVLTKWREFQDPAAMGGLDPATGIPIVGGPGEPFGSTAPTRQGKITPTMRRLLDEWVPRWGQGMGIGCWREGDRSRSEHPLGRACDFMMAPLNTRATGVWEQHAYQIIDWLIQNADALHVRYIIFQQKIWQRYNHKWRLMEDRGSLQQNHFDHIHVTVELLPGEIEY
jgi:hypothetical protein